MIYLLLDLYLALKKNWLWSSLSVIPKTLLNLFQALECWAVNKLVVQKKSVWSIILNLLIRQKSQQAEAIFSILMYYLVFGLPSLYLGTNYIIAKGKFKIFERNIIAGTCFYVFVSYPIFKTFGEIGPAISMVLTQLFIFIITCVSSMLIYRKLTWFPILQ